MSMGKRLYTPGDDIPTPQVKRKSPLNRFDYTAGKKTGKPSKENYSVGEVVSIPPRKPSSTAAKRTDSLERKTVSSDQKYNSPLRKSKQSAGQKIKDLYNQPGPSCLNGNSGKKSSSEYSNSDVEFIPHEDIKKTEKINNGITDSDFETDGSTHSIVSSTKKGMFYSKSEDKMIIKYVMGKNLLAKINGNMIWKDLEANSKLNVNKRTFHSLRNRFLRTIKPFLLTKYGYLLSDDDIEKILKTFPEFKKKFRPKQQLPFEKVKEETPEIIDIDEDSRFSSIIEARESVYRKKESDREESPARPAEIKKKLDSSKKSLEIQKNLAENLKKSPQTTSKKSTPSGIQKNSSDSSKKLSPEIEKKLCESLKESSATIAEIKRNVIESSKKFLPENPDFQKNLIETSSPAKSSGVKKNLIESFTEASDGRIEETDDDSDIIIDTPDEILLQRKISAEKKNLPPEPEVEHFSDEETQVRDLNLNILAHETGNLVTPVYTQGQRLSVPDENGSIENFLKNRRRTEKLPTPLYRRPLKTKMTVNYLLKTLHRIVNKKKRIRRERYRPRIPEAKAVVKEEEDLEDNSRAVIYKIIKDSLKTCENLLSDSDSSDNEIISQFTKKLKKFSKVENEIFFTPEKKPEQAASSSKSYEMVTGSDTDSNSSLETTYETVSDNSFKTAVSGNSSKTTVIFPMEKFNQGSLLGNMFKQLQSSSKV